MSIKRSSELWGPLDNKVQAALFYARKRRLERKRRSSVITGAPPQLAVIADGAALSTAVTWGVYDDSDETILQMKVDSGIWLTYVGATLVTEGEIWTVREFVKLDGIISLFTSNAQEVTA